MNEKERLIAQIFRLLALIESSGNQFQTGLVQQIRGLLNALRD